MSLEKLKREIAVRYGFETIKKLALHDDADGLTSGFFLTFPFKVEKVFCPEGFGEWPIEGEGKDEPPDVSCDMKPANPEWNGLCIDHHPTHPSKEERNYKLIWDNKPTSLIVYELFKELIPREHRWKVIIGLAGDGQPELTPLEIWKEYTFLLEKTNTVREKFSNLNFYSTPVYLRLTSGINACCKIPDKWYVAWKVLKVVTTPQEILDDSALNVAKKFVEEERQRLLRETSPIELRNWLRVWKIESEYKLERTLSWQSWERTKTTTIVVNEKRRTISMRGVLSELIASYLREKGFIIAGHLGFSGGRLKEFQDFSLLLQTLRGLKL